MNEPIAAPQLPRMLVALLTCAWTTILGSLAIWFEFRAPFESPRFVVGGAAPGAAIAGVGTLLAIAALYFAVRARKAVPWAGVLIALNGGYLLLFAVSI